MAEAFRPGRRAGAIFVRLLMLLAISFAALAQPAAAQSVLRDAETEALFRDMARPLVEAAGLRPENVQIVLIQSDEVNAFVAGGQAIYFYSETLTTADSANEIQGIIAHELGHITGGHVIRFNEGIKVATGITLLSLLLGAVAMAAGAGEAGAGIMAAGQQAAMGKFLAYSRGRNRPPTRLAPSILQRRGSAEKGRSPFSRSSRTWSSASPFPRRTATRERTR